MSEQLAFTLAAAGIGFVSAIFFCIGNFLQSPRHMALGDTPFWSDSPHAIRPVAAQRAQSLVGGLMLVVSFLLQIAAALASPTSPAALPQALQPWPNFLLAVLVPSGLFGAVFARLHAAATMREVLRLHKERRQ